MRMVSLMGFLLGVCVMAGGCSFRNSEQEPVAAPVEASEWDCEAGGALLWGTSVVTGLSIGSRNEDGVVPVALVDADGSEVLWCSLEGGESGPWQVGIDGETQGSLALEEGKLRLDAPDLFSQPVSFVRDES